MATNAKQYVWVLDSTVYDQIGLKSKRHEEPFVLGAEGEEIELWVLVPECLGKPELEAIAFLETEHRLDFQKSRAVWKYINHNPTRAKMLVMRHSGGYEEVYAE